ncbi:ATP-binding cassette domain-containing protein [Pseudonocardia sp. ICBG601]|uniref:ATP-binding cassette domain-containing protein n=1 Tax=Pseudonocardia sp. ICBG601 TaxID=2846759 RepID=UPI001CF709FD|nr:ATP-binding cassette domain-containing protein [Pseudonocardia sp. ICBG601]
MNTPAIEVDGLVRTFGEVRAVDGISFSAGRGQVLGLLGPNGSGKTTTVRMLATLLPPSAGRAAVLGRDVVGDAAGVRSLIGLTGQYAAVDEALTGRDNLYLIGRLLDLPRSAARARAAELIDRFGLTDAAGRRAGTYSGGMRRRLDLAASLVGRPEVLFLDEPTTGLDPLHRNEVWDAVRRLAEDGVTVLLTTQYLEEADQLAHDLVVLDHGRVIASGTAAQLKSRAAADACTSVPSCRARCRWSPPSSPRRPAPSRRSSRPGRSPRPSPTTARCARTEDRLVAEGVAVAEIGLRLPSLDDVFLSLTGHAAETTSGGPR